MQDGVLHVHGISIGQGLDRAVVCGDTVLVTRLDPPNSEGGTTVHVDLLEGGTLVPVPELTSVGLSNHETGYYPHLSADGNVAVAMSWHDGTTLRMTAWSVSQRRVLGTVDVRDRMIAQEEIAGIEDNGTVLYVDPDAQRGYAWLPGHAPQALDAAEHTAIGRGALVVGDSGITVVKLGRGSSIEGVSPDGRSVLIGAASGTESVMSLSTGKVVDLQPPADVYIPVGSSLRAPCSSPSARTNTGRSSGAAPPRVRGPDLAQHQGHRVAPTPPRVLRSRIVGTPATIPRRRWTGSARVVSGGTLSATIDSPFLLEPVQSSTSDHAAPHRRWSGSD